MSWDGCISEDYLWLMDNGDIDSLRAIYGNHPNGRFKAEDSEVLSRLSWQRAAPWSGPQRLLRFSLLDGSLKEFHLLALRGGIIAPPVNVPEHKMCRMGQYQRRFGRYLTDSENSRWLGKLMSDPPCSQWFSRFG